MVKATFEHEGNNGLLTIVTHFGETYKVVCKKEDDEIFRLGGTAVNDIASYEGVILSRNDSPLSSSCKSATFRAFRSEQNTFEGEALLSNEEWDDSNLHCYATECYGLYMEGSKPGWIVSKSPVKDANYLFINIDILDGGGNLIKRYRASPYICQYRIM